MGFWTLGPGTVGVGTKSRGETIDLLSFSRVHRLQGWFMRINSHLGGDPQGWELRRVTIGGKEVQ